MKATVVNVYHAKLGAHVSIVNRDSLSEQKWTHQFTNLYATMAEAKKAWDYVLQGVESGEWERRFDGIYFKWFPHGDEDVFVVLQNETIMEF